MSTPVATKGLVCPHCRHPLFSLREIEVSCELCNKSYAVVDEIIDFLGEDYSYSGQPIPRAEIRRLIQRSEMKGWKEALADIILENQTINGDYLIRSNRMDWFFHCMSQMKAETCLDLGSGLGSLAFLLSPYFHEIWSLDASLENLIFQNIRKKQDRANNIKLIKADMFRCPFQDNYFDLVVLNGVLEWAGFRSLSETPRQLQLSLLSEVKRILKRDGVLYVGIENRYGAHYVLGQKDHSGLAFTSLLPRKISDLLVDAVNMIRGNTPTGYRTYTYTANGYKKLLREAGFRQIELYWTLSYIFPSISAKFEDTSSYQWFLRTGANMGNYQINRALTLLCRLIPKQVVKHFSPCFLIYAYPQQKEVGLEERILKDRNQHFVRLSGHNSVIYLATNSEGKVDKVVRFARFSEGTNKIRDMEARYRIFSDTTIEELGISFGTRRFNVFIEKGLDGQQCNSMSVDSYKKTLRWLLDFQNKTKKGYYSPQAVASEISDLGVFLSRINIKKEAKTRIHHDLQTFADMSVEVPLEIVSEHGDFCHKNVIEVDGKIYVLDWEYYRDVGNPLFDFWYFIISSSLTGTKPLEYFYQSFTGQNKFSRMIVELVNFWSFSKSLPRRVIYGAVPYVLMRLVVRTYPVDGGLPSEFVHSVRALNTWASISSSKETSLDPKLHNS